MTKEEFTKMKQELEAEYLATFKKTVAMHEVFLQRLAIHPKFRNDSNFRIFLEYENEVSYLAFYYLSFLWIINVLGIESS
jgi:sorting nexin-5/6/32